MLSATLLSFFGGAGIRLLFGEIVNLITKWQDHGQELQRIAAQAKADADQHARNMDSIRTQAELGVKTITVQSQADISKIEAEGWGQAVKDVGKQTGIWLVDLWNAVIRPALATWSVVMLTLDEFGAITMTGRTEEICAAALGIYLASRDLFKRGK